MRLGERTEDDGSEGKHQAEGGDAGSLPIFHPVNSGCRTSGGKSRHSWSTGRRRRITTYTFTHVQIEMTQSILSKFGGDWEGRVT